MIHISTGPTRAVIFTLVSLASLVLAEPGLVVAASPRWAVVPSPNVQIWNGSFAAVSCPSTSTCFAAGSYSNDAGVSHALIGMKTDTGWATIPAPTPTGAAAVRLDAISCAQASWCMAAGHYDTAIPALERPFSDVWNGRHWSVLPTPVPEASVVTGSLAAVSCSSSSVCMAVGHYAVDGTDKPLAERWNGHAWSLGPTRALGDNVAGTLNGVSCPSARFCLAVGAYTNNSSIAWAVSEKWHSGRWGPPTNLEPQSPPPGPLTYAGSGLLGVSCPSANACMAAGQFEVSDQDSEWSLPMLQRWNGRAWRLETGAPLSDSNRKDEFQSVSCPSALDCTAVASYSPADPGYGRTGPTVIEHWNGKRWTLEPAPDLPSTDTVAVSCPRADACVAVGSYANPLPPTLLLALGWNGKRWRSQSVPPLRGVTFNSLSGVSCSAPTLCTAVGYWVDGQGQELPLTERRSRGQWAIQTAPNPGAGVDAGLDGVACPSSTSCMAFGNYGGKKYLTAALLLEHWNGSGWTDLPAQGPPRPFLSAISCPSTGTCAVVGSYQSDSNEFLPLVEWWNGHGWATLTPASRTRFRAALTSVSCQSPNMCTAAGFSFHPDGFSATPVIYSGNGKTWTERPVPLPHGVFSAELEGISCLATDACFAVGHYQMSDSDPYHSLIERLVGSRWVMQRPAGPSGWIPSAVSCSSGDACTAIGGGPCIALECTGILVQVWNGHQWTSKATATRTSDQTETVQGISCPTGHACTLVGTIQPPYTAGFQIYGSRTLIEQYRG